MARFKSFDCWDTLFSLNLAEYLNHRTDYIRHHLTTLGRVVVLYCVVNPGPDAPETDEYPGVEEDEDDEGDESYDEEYSNKSYPR